MASQTTPPSYNQFSIWVREVLKHLYDSAYLQTHPLADTLVDEAADGRHRSQELRRIFIEGIQNLYPQGQVSAGSPDWRTYKILELRYIHGMNWAKVMEELALGKTLYYDSHALALEALTQVLWDGWQKKSGAPLISARTSTETRAEEAQLTLTHMLAQATWEAIQVVPVLDELRALVMPLAQAKSVSLFLDVSHPITVLHADRVVLRQTILNVITYSLDFGAGGRVVVQSFAEGIEAGVTINAWKGTGRPAPGGTQQRQGFGLDICEQLMQEMGGILYLKFQGENEWQARLAWPTSVDLTLLVIDDNAGLVDLLSRYLAGTDWRILGATSGVQGRQIFAQNRPGVIILDVMMPGEDGWELLLEFKAQESTRDIPVVVCSVFNEPQLARNLGAAAYLTKPVTQRALLQTLKPWSQVGATLAPTP